MDRETIQSLVISAIAIIVIVLVLFFGIRQAIYCLQTTGQIQCAIIAPAPTQVSK